MPVFLPHAQINKKEWDRCVLQAANPLLYACSWYLDAVAPNWCAVVEKGAGNSYSAVMPLPVKWRLGFGFVYQPPFTQQLGIFSVNEDTDKLLMPFLEVLPANIKHLSLSLHTGHQLSEFHFRGIEETKRITHHLHLNRPYAELLKNYKGNQRRAIQKPLPAHFNLSETNSISDTISLFRQTSGTKISDLKDKHYQLLQRLILVLQEHKLVQFIEIRDGEELVSGAVFVTFAGRIIYLFSANSQKARDISANARILDYLIQQNAGRNIVLDFEGGNIAGIGHFFRSFGAAPAEFVSLKMNRLPWPLSKLVK